ncbi:MAG: membrane associated rhomboid family serine protease [Gammaproteobacteria bacterium]|jgi:membrane associated rhomboid family serine protease
MTRFLVARVQLLSALATLLLGIRVANCLSHGQLNQFGIVPRSLESLPHILSASFLHGNFGHLFNNLLSLLVLSAFALIQSVRFYVVSRLIIIAFSGLLVWLFGRGAVHTGASGWIFGLWSLAIANAWFERNFKNIAILVVMIILYGGMAFGVLPTDPRIFYEAHQAGVVSGVVWAYLNAKFKRNGGSAKLRL